ncbi:MAG: hypothetical protein EOO28_16470 [Comamonadaceae bacterium]|nr:MAG: hypothetical protein EOO28_16470 [Comamonadaceae bacterium]
MNQNHPSPDLYAELQADTTGARRDALLATLHTMQDTCIAAERKLNDRDAYQRIQSSRAAVAAAIKIVNSATSLACPVTP